MLNSCLDLVVWLNVTWLTLETLTDNEVLAVVARNKKGASEPVILKDLVFRDAAKRTGKCRNKPINILDIDNHLYVYPHQVTWVKYSQSDCFLDHILSRGSIHFGKSL